MRQLTLAAGAACAVLLGAPAGAQNPGSSMPGQVVSNYSGNSYATQLPGVGQQFPSAAPRAGQPITANENMRPYDPTRPFDAFKGTNLDLSNVAAPVVGPDGKQYQPPDALDRLSQKIKDFFRIHPPPPPKPTVTPGIFRRNRERHEDRMWRRD